MVFDVFPLIFLVQLGVLVLPPSFRTLNLEMILPLSVIVLLHLWPGFRITLSIFIHQTPFASPMSLIFWHDVFTF